jgi:hypothetical protein
MAQESSERAEKAEARVRVLEEELRAMRWQRDVHVEVCQRVQLELKRVLP